MDCRLMDLDVGDMNEFMNGLKEWMLNILFFQKNLNVKLLNWTHINWNYKKVFKFIISYYFIQNLKETS